MTTILRQIIDKFLDAHLREGWRVNYEIHTDDTGTKTLRVVAQPIETSEDA